MLEKGVPVAGEEAEEEEEEEEAEAGGEEDLAWVPGEGREEVFAAVLMVNFRVPCCCCCGCVRGCCGVGG